MKKKNKNCGTNNMNKNTNSSNDKHMKSNNTLPCFSVSCGFGALQPLRSLLGQRRGIRSENQELASRRGLLQSAWPRLLALVRLDYEY